MTLYLVVQVFGGLITALVIRYRCVPLPLTFFHGGRS